ncbi:MAG: hypothetical protein GDA47_00245 [Rhodospirillales bacterium]|nr:hypothetical protein [Rhodospirillales bacterium]
MADPIDLAPPVAAAALDPQEAVEFFRAKGYAPPENRFSYRDWWGTSHARGFVVAKAMQDDLMADIRGAVDRAIAEGKTLRQFREELEPKLKAAGWWGRKTLTDPLTGETRTVQLGSRRRLAVIFDTNLRTSYAAGRWMRIQRTKDLLPFLLYSQLQRVNKRDAHAPFHRILLPADHPFWATHYPPNGYFCACTVRQLSEAAVKRRGLAVSPDPPIETRTWTDPRTGRRLRVPKGVTPGFDNNPGASFLADRGRYRAIAGDLSPEAQGIELGLIHEARSRGIRTGNEHVAALDLAAERPIPGSNAAPVDWNTKGERGKVGRSDAMTAAVTDPARRISVVHNHPEAKSLSSKDLLRLETEPGLARVIVVGHDGSLYRASDPKQMLGYFADRLWQLAWVRIHEEAVWSGMHSPAMRNLANHAANTALDRAGYMNYASALAGGSRVNLQRFGEDRMERIIAGLVQWLGSG